MENIQAKMKELFGGSCQPYCYAYIANPTDSIKVLTNRVLKGWNEGYIDDDGYVSKPVQYYNGMTNGRKIRDVRIVAINNLDELPEGQMFSVEFKLQRTDKKSHFAVCIKGKIIFDPSGESNTCKYGVPVSYRKFEPVHQDNPVLEGSWVVRNKEPL
jgi:hypothetical protein